MKIYKSKISIGLTVFLLILFAFIGYEMFSESFNFLAVIFFIVPILFCIYVFISIKYTITDSNLNIKAGFLVNWDIDIATIQKISETNNIMSSPAASLDRLEIIYNKYNSIIISPQRKKQFISDLLAINPNIEVTPKLKTNIYDINKS